MLDEQINSITVTTKEELSEANKKHYDEIIVKGKLANDLKKSKKIALASSLALIPITALLAMAPFTGGVSALGAAGVAGITGLEIAAITSAATIGLALLLAIYKDYEEISYGEGKITLRKKAKNDSATTI